jgi:hypothetical protein
MEIILACRMTLWESEESRIRKFGLAPDDSLTFLGCSGNRGGGARYNGVAAIHVKMSAVIAR